MGSMRRVLTAEPYRSGELGSFGKASSMLIRQFQFPDTYHESDRFVSADDDRLRGWDYKHTRRAFSEHTGCGELALERWVNGATDAQILAFLCDVLKAAADAEWTGYRILGTVNRSSGYVVWSLQLFAKHPESATQVYSGRNAPNVKRPQPGDDLLGDWFKN